MLLPASLGISAPVGLIAAVAGLEGLPVAAAGRRPVGLAGLLLVVMGLTTFRRVGADPASVRLVGVDEHDMGDGGSGCMASLLLSGELAAAAARSAEAMACAMASSTGVRTYASPPNTAAGRGSCSSCVIRCGGITGSAGEA